MVVRFRSANSELARFVFSVSAALVAHAVAAQGYDANDNPIPPPALPTAARHVVRSRHAPSAGRVPGISERAIPTIAVVVVRASSYTLKASASALCKSGDRLFLGLADGGVAYCDAETGSGGKSIRFPQKDLPVRGIAHRDGCIWWISGDGARVFAYRERDETVVAYPVGAPTPPPAAPRVDTATTPFLAPATPVFPPLNGWVTRLTPWGRRILLLGDGVARLLDPKTGVLSRPGTEDVPTDLVQPDGTLTLYAAQDEDGKSLITGITTDRRAGMDPPRIFEADGERPKRGWRTLDETTPIEPTGSLVSYPGQAPASAFPMLFVPRTAEISPCGCALIGATGLHLVCTSFGGAHQGGDIAFGGMPGMPTTLDTVAVGASGAWWLMRGTLFHADTDGTRPEAYLPWNSARGARILAVLPDRDGIYLALDRGGVRRIVPGKPSLSDGYSGFVRARLGTESMLPATGPESEIAGEIEAWQGVPYLWGGQTKQGTDCSGFVGAMHRAAGFDIPRSTAEMSTSSQGTRVFDEIRYGDVLVYPGHCALYIGNGVTAETLTSRVAKASIWRRSEVLVRRYLP